MQTTAAQTALQQAKQEQERADALSQHIDEYKAANEKLVNSCKQTQTELTTSYQKQKVCFNCLCALYTYAGRAHRLPQG